MPPRFTHINRQTTEEHEATSKYRTPTEWEKGQTIHKELGAQDITKINEDWYPSLESEAASTVRSILDLAQPMDIDQPSEEQPYQMFEASDVLCPDQGPGSPVTAGEDQFLGMPGSFSRAPEDGRPPTGSPGWRITGRVQEKHLWKPG